MSRQYETAARHAIVIAGMHRSGTSALARVLSLLGATLPKRLMPGGEFNKAGHWESTTIMQLHEDILGSMGSAWHDWGTIESRWFKSRAAKSFQARLATAVREEYGGSQLFVVKDPRICRLLPLWLNVLKDLNIAPYVVIPLRNPIEVAQSLVQRDHVVGELREPKLAHAYLLWLRSVLEAEFVSRSVPRALLTYDALIDGWQGAVKLIASRTGVVWPRKPATAAGEIEQFLSRRLRHHAVGQGQLDQQPQIASWVKGTYAVLLQLVQHDKNKKLLTELDEFRSALDASSQSFAPLIADAARRVELERQAVLRLSGEIEQERRNLESRLANQTQELRREIANLKNALAAARSERTRVEQLRQHETETLIELRAKVDQSRQREQELLNELEAVRLELQIPTQMLDGYSNALQTAKIDVESLEGKLRKSTEEHARAVSHARNLSVQLAALAESNEEALVIAESRIRAVQLELTAEKQESQAAIAATAEVGSRLEDTEAQLHREEERLRRSDEKLIRIRDQSERARALNEQLRAQLATVLPERTVLAQRLEKLDEELRQSVVRAADLDGAVREGEQALRERNTQLSFLMLRESIVRDLAASSKAVRPSTGQLPLGLVFDAAAQLRPSGQERFEPRRKRRAEWKAVAESGLFDAKWYLARNPDVAAARVSAFAHFMSYGLVEGRDPHPLFSSGWYRIQMHRHNAPMDLPPLLHYMSVGRGQKLSPHPLFDSQYYLACYRDVAESGIDPLQHFLAHGAAELRNPHPLVWMQRLTEQPEFSGKSGNALIDYLNDRQLFAASPHPLFDAAAYLAHNPDVAQAGVNPLLHYLAMGWRQGRPPHRLFAGDWYLAHNADVLAADIDPLTHYVRHGAQEYRAPHPFFDAKFYYARYREARRLPYDALSDYILNGLGDKPRETSAQISVADIRALVPPYLLDNAPPIVAFLDANFSVARPATRAEAAGARDRAAWPPAPIRNYWLPQRLRDYIVERFGEPVIELYVYLMAIVERHGQRQDIFPHTREFATICDRLRLLAAKRRADVEVDVSVVVPVYNNLIYTLTSLVSLLEQDSRFAIEVLIGDDGSTDATPKVFASAGGCIRLIRHERNLGFLGNCNQTASFANGCYIAFLNNDTLLLPGWIDELVDALERVPRAGLAGSKLLNADGTLQEAGGILWRDGSGWNFGRNDDPALPACNYLKDVDYVSGAALALPAALWRQLGGFDAEFAPAYCEDSDLAFRVRQTGLRTLYVPHSVLIHHEGKSHGRDTEGGIKAYQVANQRKLLARWRDVLAENHNNAENVFVARDRSTRKPHILFVDHYVPQWDRDAGSRTIFHFLRMFVVAGFQISFWPDNLFEDKDYCGPLQRMGVEVMYGPSHVGAFDKFVAEAGPFLDYALVSRPNVAINYYEAIRTHSKARILYYGHDVHWKRMEQERAVVPAAAVADFDAAQKVQAMQDLETENWDQADVVLYPSIEERDLVRSLAAERRAEQVPMLGYLAEELAVAHENLARFDRRSADELLFVGGSHPPNVDALLWFAREVMPLVQAGNPAARLNIVGSTMAAAVERLDSETIRVLGRVSDDELATLYASMGVALVPLRYGAGVKGKTLEAFVKAIPLVTTSVGLQGIASAEPLAFVADDASGLADAVLRAQTDRTVARAQVETAVRYMERAYSIQALRAAFAPFVHELAPARMTDLAATVAGK
jgi:GT2 family glycosyltransferase